jgi:hypothetical protein
VLRVWALALGSMDLRFYSGTGNYEADTPQMLLDASGNVGIGTTSPDLNSGYTALTMSNTSGSGGGQVYVKSSVATGVFGADNAGSGAKVILQTNTSHPLSIGTNNAERMRIDSNSIRVATDEFTPTGSGKDLGSPTYQWRDLYLSGGILADGISTVSSIRENVTTDSSTSGVLNISLLGTSVRYLTANQTANRTLNFRGDVSTSLDSIMAVGESITTVVIATQGTTAYYFNTIQIDTSAVTPKWQGGSAPTGGNASSIDSYSFTIIKTASATFTVLASQTQFA